MALNNLDLVAEAYERIARSTLDTNPDKHYADTLRNFFAAYVDLIDKRDEKGAQKRYDKLGGEILEILCTTIKKYDIKDINVSDIIDRLKKEGKLPYPLMLGFYIGYISQVIKD